MMPASKQTEPAVALMSHERPAVLLPLFVPIRGLQGVGSALERRLTRLLARTDPTAFDLLTHLPTAFLDTSPARKLDNADEGLTRTLSLRIVSHQLSGSGSTPSRVTAIGPTGELDLVFFGKSMGSIANRFPVNTEMLVQGRLQRYGERWQIAHPDVLKAADAGQPLPVYPSSRGLHQGTIRKLIERARSKLAKLPEWQEPNLLRAAGWPSFGDAISSVHLKFDDLSSARLAMDELLAGQLALRIARRHRDRVPGCPIQGNGGLQAQLIASLPFRLTDQQRQALDEIQADLRGTGAMLRLLQGDVGSGKTLVAILAMLTALEAGHQAALMAPTDVLASQHGRTLSNMLQPLRIEPLLLTGRIKGKERAALLNRLQTAEPLIVVGTHALLQEQAVFGDLALAVIDEQHRFGVRQRLNLRSKGHAVNLLLMTATPIPRTAAMSAYGDIATSSIAERPPGRLPIATAAVPIERIVDVIEAVRRRLARGDRVYWVCPLVEPNEHDDRSAVEARAELLRSAFGDQVGFAHGRLKDQAKDQAMRSFAAGRTKLLVATTVIEVGVDVPEASLIVIEGAERFGLAQLHQLRGRVGRGTIASTCILLWRGPLSATAKARLEAIRASEDGFKLAEDDLRLRGPGEILGDRQSGLPELRLANLQRHAELVPLAAASARRILADDPGLSSERGRATRVLLHLFRRTDVLGLLDGG